MDWIDLAQDKEYLRALVKTVINLGVPFFSSWATSGVSVRSELHGVSESRCVKFYWQDSKHRKKRKQSNRQTTYIYLDSQRKSSFICHAEGIDDFPQRCRPHLLKVKLTL
jgi:hypothetical protein